MRDFRKLLAWQKADDLVIMIYQATGHFPADERYGLISQTRRAAVSVAANIAEGSGRHTLVDFRRFLHQARGSLNEVEYYIHLTKRLGYLPDEERKPLMDLCQETGKVLQGLLNSLDKQIRAGRKTN